MPRKYLSFEFSQHYKDFSTIGSGLMTAAFCASTPSILFDPGVSVCGPPCLRWMQENKHNTHNLIIALSHSHFDHCGSAAYLLRHLPTARVAASERCADVLKRPNAIATIRRLNEEYEADVPADIAGHDVSFEPITVTYRLKEGDSLELAEGRKCRVIETGGHTRDSLSYHFPDTGMVFVGEAAGVLEHGFIHSPFLVSYEGYITSIAKIRDLRPPALCIAHNGILTGEAVDRYLVESTAAAVAYQEMVRNYLELYKGDQDCVVERITREEYEIHPHQIQKRNPYILNLRAKVNAVAVWLAGQKRG